MSKLNMKTIFLLTLLISSTVGEGPKGILFMEERSGNDIPLILRSSMPSTFVPHLIMIQPTTTESSGSQSRSYDYHKHVDIKKGQKYNLRPVKFIDLAIVGPLASVHKTVYFNKPIKGPKISKYYDKKPSLEIPYPTYKPHDLYSQKDPAYYYPPPDYSSKVPKPFIPSDIYADSAYKPHDILSHIYAHKKPSLIKDPAYYYPPPFPSESYSGSSGDNIYKPHDLLANIYAHKKLPLIKNPNYYYETPMPNYSPPYYSLKFQKTYPSNIYTEPQCICSSKIPPQSSYY